MARQGQAGQPALPASAGGSGRLRASGAAGKQAAVSGATSSRAFHSKAQRDRSDRPCRPRNTSRQLGAWRQQLGQGLQMHRDE